jgi:hypothetical protein
LATKPTLIVSGNCQARFVSRILEANAEVKDKYRIVYFRAFRKGDTGTIKREDLESCAVLLEQIAHQAPELPDKEHLPAGAQIHRFPILWLNTLWPQAIDDPRNELSKSPEHPGGLWPYGDRFILKLLDQGFSAQQAAAEYMNWNLAEKLDLERFHHINWAKAKELDRRAEIKLGRYVEENFRKERLFVTRNHPSQAMLTVVRDKVYEALGLPAPADDSDVEPASGGMYDSHVPVHPSVARHFELEWWSPDLPYRTHGDDMAIEEYLRRYAAFE